MKYSLQFLLPFVGVLLLCLLLVSGAPRVYAQSTPTLTIPTDIPAMAGGTVDVPIMYTSNGAEIVTLIFSLNYNDSCLSVDPTDANNDDIPDNVTINVPFDTGVNYDPSDIDSELDFFMIDFSEEFDPLEDGVLAVVTFDVSLDCPGTNAVVLFSTAPSASFGNVGGQSVPGVTVGGSVEIAPWTLSGQILYRDTGRPVNGVTVDLTGAGVDQVMTDADGHYTFTLTSGGPYTVTPSLSGQVNGISSFDAAYIAQCTTGLRPIEQCPLIVADASGNGALSSFDAARIAQYIVGLSGPTTRVGTWIFEPDAMVYASLSGSLTDQDFTAYLIGDVSGNWQPPVNAAASPTATD